MPKKKVNTSQARRLVAKTVEDKTFGMKNKKGAKARKYIAEVENQAKAKFMHQNRARGVVNEQQQAAEKKKRKEAIKKEAVMMAQMLGISVEDAKAAFTGKKVKKKKPAVMSASAETEGEGKKKKKGAKGKPPASEQSAIAKAQAKRRALRRARKKEAGEEYEIDESLYEEDTPIEEMIEEERRELINSGQQLTPITFENFMAWKRKKKLKKDNAAIAAKHISGRLLFEQNAEKYNVDDAAAANDAEYEVTEEVQGPPPEDDLGGIPDIDSIPDIHSSDEEDDLPELPESITGGGDSKSATSNNDLASAIPASESASASASASAPASAPAPAPAAASAAASASASASASLFLGEELDDLDDLDDLE